jgi:hypothetical protein
MTDKPKKDLPASVRQQLLNLSKERGQPFDLVLVRYGIERLLYRLSRSPHAGKFLLKGAMLFVVWGENAPRPTRDVDLLGFGPADEAEVKANFVELCGLVVEPDGLEFLAASVKVGPVREDAAYIGIRVALEARLGKVRISIQVDIGYGDAVTPAPAEVDFPALLDFPAPRLRAYPYYTVVAEKLEAAVLLGATNTRLKDFFDLWYLSRKFDFEGPLLAEAITRTFARRKTTIPAAVPVALTNEFAAQKSAQWVTYLRRNAMEPVEFSAVLAALRDFALPVLQVAASESAFAQQWKPARGWH